MADLETEMEGEAVDANASSEPLLVEHGARTDGEDAEQLPEHHAGAEPDDAAETGAPAEAAQADAPAAADGGPDEPITADEGTRRLADGAASKLVADPAAAGAPPSLVHALGKKLKVALPRGPPPAPRHLLFQSWWVESHTRRVVEVAFELGTERFRVTVDKEVHMLSSELLHTQRADSFLPTVAKDTKVLECFLHEKLSDNQRARSLELPHLQCWDLHVGAKLNLFGRPTTLMACEIETRLWLEYHAHALHAVLGGLEAALRKFELGQPKNSHRDTGEAARNPERSGAASSLVRPSGAFSRAMPDRRAHSGAGRDPRCEDLRSMLQHAHALRERLAQYRPGLAAEFAQLVGMLTEQFALGVASPSQSGHW